jgi:hypothetical protein
MKKKVSKPTDTLRRLNKVVLLERDMETLRKKLEVEYTEKIQLQKKIRQLEVRQTRLFHPYLL